MKTLINKFVDWLIDQAQGTPYSDLLHADGSLYMGRWWIVKPRDWLPFAVRLHHIATPDYDRHMHDHPWAFVSLVLRGSYLEARPVDSDPCFAPGSERELSGMTRRRAGSIAYRRATDRHRITWVSPGGVYTLVITSNKRHWWGFYTPRGKIWWREYESVHRTVR